METLPKLGYRFVGEVEAAGEGRGAETAATAAPVEATGRRVASRRRLAVVSAVVVALVVAAVAWRALRPPAVARAGKAMLVVLPFENLSGDPAQDYLGDGLTEDMITQLARLGPSRLGIIARTTAMKYKGARKSADEVGRELGVDYVLEGSIRREGQRVRITAQLIAVRDQTHLWAQSFDRELGDLLSVQREVSQSVAASIQPAVSGPVAPGARTEVPSEAYQEYLRARFYHAQGTIHGVEQAIQYYNAAIEKDPTFARAYAGLARAYIFGVRMRPRDALRRAKEQAERALRLDAALPEAHLAVAMTRLYYDWDWAGAEKEFLRALELDSGNADAHFYFSHYLAAVGWLEEAIASAERARQLDPFSPLVVHYLGRLHFFAGHSDRAVAEYRKTLELNPRYPWATLFLAVSYQQAGDFDKAVAYRQKYWALMGVPPEQVNQLGQAYATSGYAEVVRRWADWIEGFVRRDGYVTSTELALLHTFLEDKKTALRWLERAFADHARDLIFLKVHPEFGPLRSDPRFQKLFDGMRFPAS